MITPRPHASVAEVNQAGVANPFPAGEWNAWHPGKPVETAFVGTNAVRFGPEGDLWVVDTGSPSFGAEVLPHAAKIVQINLNNDNVRRIYPLDANVVLPKSYVDDIRFHGGKAYLTDAGVPGIIVLDLATGRARRVLDHDKSTTGSSTISVDGVMMRGPDGQPLIIHADQLEVSPDGRWLYFQPLAGPLYRVETKLLDDPSVPAAGLSRSVELWYQTNALGGTAMDSMGNLYLEDLANDSILKLSPDRKLTTVIQDHRLHWADAPWLQDGYLYLPVAQIDRASQFNGGVSKIAWPLRIYRLQLTSVEKH